MEWILLLLLGGLAAGTAFWAAGGKEEDSSDLRRGTGPRSSPDLPEAGGAGSGRDRGQPVVVGSGSKEEAARAIRQAFESAPDSVQGKLLQGEPDKVQETLDKLKEDRRQKRRKPLKVSYGTDEIVPRSSPHAHHRRPLQSAESLVENQQADEALSIYQRVMKRIPDEVPREKINTNIEDIKRWQEGLDLEEDEGFEFPEIIIPLTTQALALENLSEGLRNLSDTLSRQIGEALAQALARQPIQGQFSGDLRSGGESSSPGPAPGASSSGAAAPAQAPATSAPSALSSAPASAPPSGSPASSAASGPAVATGITSFAPAGYSTSEVPPGIPQVAVPSAAVPTGEIVQGYEPADYADYGHHGLDVDNKGNVRTDGWTDEDFEREWEKYKNLPAFDRRSGKDRRSGTDRRGKPDPNRPDRRSGEDRRKKDLFKERDEFLKKLEQHRENKKKLEELKKKPPEPIKFPAAPGLPAGEAEKDEAVIRIENARIEIGEWPARGEPAEPTDEEPEPRLRAEPKPEPEPEAEPELESEPEPEQEEEKEESEPETQKIDHVAATDLEPLGFPSPLEDELTPPDETGGEPEPMETRSSMGEDELGEGVEAAEFPDSPPEEPQQVQEIRGVLELKPPDEDDAPFLTLTYDFAKIPDSFKLSRDYHTMEYAYYKYKPMLIKAQEFTRRKMLKNALNYYRVIKSQNIPPEFKRMINRNIRDITDYLEKFLMSRSE